MSSTQFPDGQPDRCQADSFWIAQSPLGRTHVEHPFNRCTFDLNHLGDHRDEFGQVFRLDGAKRATIVKVLHVSPGTEQVNRGFFDVPKSDVEKKEQDAEEERVRGTRFSEQREYPGMNGFPLTALQDPGEPDSETRRLARIVGLHWASEGNAYGGPVRSQCVECEKDYPCETVRIAMGLQR